MMGPMAIKARYIDSGAAGVAQGPKPIPALKTPGSGKKQADLKGRISEQRGQRVRSGCLRRRERPPAKKDSFDEQEESIRVGAS